MNITDRAAVRQIITTFEASGAKIPKAVAAAHAALSKLESRARDLGTGANVGVLAVAVADALAADRDPATDPEVQRLVTLQTLTGEAMRVRLEGLAYDRFRGVCREHADAIVHAWRTPFDRDTATLHDAHARLGDIDLTDAAAVLSKRGDAAEVWARARSAEQSLDAMITAWTMLMMFTHLATTNKPQRPFRFTVPPTEFDSALTPWQAVKEGLELSLPTASEYAERVRANAAARAAASTVVHPERSRIARHEIRVPVQ